MLAGVEAALPADIFVAAAAVADWSVAAAPEKLKKTPARARRPWRSAKIPDILATISARRADRPTLVVGFAAETGTVVENAVAKRARKGCDLIVANDVSPAGGVFGGDENEAHIVTAEGVESWPRLPKDEVAARLVARIIGFFGERP